MYFVKLLIKADRLIDGTGDKPRERAAILIEDGRIIAVDTQTQLDSVSPDSLDVVDVGQQTIMPGLVEAHAHMHCTGEPDAFEKIFSDDQDTLLLRASKAMRASLISGVTTMRDLGSRNEVAFPIKQAIQDGVIPGPRLLVAGTPITTTAGHCNMFGTEADTEDEVVTAIRRQAKLGADCIKMMSTGGNFTPRSNVRAAQYPASTLRAAVEDAERLGLTVAAHCHGTIGVRNCVEAGIHHLIHCSWLAADAAEEYDYDPALADTIAENGTYVDPTIALGRLRYLADPDADVFKPGGAFSNIEERYRILRDMWDRGVKFIAGLDAGMQEGRFGSHAMVPQVMVENMGISPMDAIKCSTSVSAEALGVLPITGTLAIDKSADVIVVDGDPSQDITALHRVTSVIHEGTVVKREGRVLV